MRPLVLLGALAAVVAFASLSTARPPAAAEAEGTVVRGELGERIAEAVAAFGTTGFSGAVLVARNGEVVAAVAVGPASLDGSIQNTPDALFEIASITKQFTGAAVMRLVMDGKLALDDPIAKHLPGIPDDCRAITIEHLLRHTSGIPGSNAHGRGTDLAAVLPTFLDGGPRHEPGTHWEYWNQGYALLSEIIARAAGMSYVDYVRTALFAPAGMTSSRFTGDPAPDGITIAIGRSSRGPARSALDHPYGEYGFQYRGMGGAVNSVWDLWRWDRALKAGTILDADATAALLAPGLNNYALGWFVDRDDKGRLRHWHGGGVRGFTSTMHRFPEQDATVIVLSGDDGGPNPHSVAALVIGLLLGDFDSTPFPVHELEPELATSLIGSYRTTRGRTLDIRAEERDGVTRVRAGVRWSSRGPVAPAAIGRDRSGIMRLFDGSPYAREIELRRDAAGKIDAIEEIVGNGHANEVFRRFAGGAAVDDPQRLRDAGVRVDPGMNVMVTTRPYERNEHGVSELPPTLRWIVLPQYRSTVGVDDRITLVLNDQERQFWPVIARMDLDVAERLVADLQAMIEQKRRGR